MNSADCAKPSIVRALIVPLIFLAVTLPSLGWREFTNGSENLNVAAAMEIRRTGNWLIPTLAGNPRIAKPPLTAWITASFIRQSTLDMLESPSDETRDAGYKRLAFETRLPATIASALILVAAYWLGALTGGNRRGMLMAMILASTYGMMRLGRISATDVHLSLWVSFAVVTIVKTLISQIPSSRKQGDGTAVALPDNTNNVSFLNNPIFLGLLTGIFLGLAFMSKGPVAIVMTLAPAAIASFWLYKTEPGFSPPPLKWWFSALFAMLAVGLPWFGWVLHVNGISNTMHLWWVETSREGATDISGNGPVEYMILFPLFLPWMVFFIGGIIMMLVPDLRKHPHVKTAFCMIAIPVLIMLFFRDRKERYLQPLLLAGTWLTALAFERWETDKNKTRALALHVAILFGAGVAFPIVATFGKIPEIPAATKPALATALVGMGVIFWIALRWRENHRIIALGSWAIMIIAQNIFVAGYANTDLSGSRPFSEKLREYNAHARPWCYKSGDARGPNDFSIYLNRTVKMAKNIEDVPQSATGMLVIWRVDEIYPFLGSNWIEIDRYNDKKRYYAIFVNKKADEE